MPLGVHSEGGKLRRVMVHRPGLEHARLTPSNAEEQLFDDVLWVARAKAEHYMFAEAMRDRGVEVFEAETPLAQALAHPEARSGCAARPLALETSSMGLISQTMRAEVASGNTV
jgi:arginine deiminase